MMAQNDFAPTPNNEMEGDDLLHDARYSVDTDTDTDASPKT